MASQNEETFKKALNELGSALVDQRIEAANTLATLKDARATEPLMKALKDPYECVQRAAVHALIAIVKVDKSIIPDLIKAAENKKLGIRGWAIQILGHSDDTLPLRILTLTLRDKSFRLPNLAQEALVQMGIRAVPALKYEVEYGQGLAKELATKALAQIQANMSKELLNGKPKPFRGPQAKPASKPRLTR